MPCSNQFFSMIWNGYYPQEFYVLSHKSNSNYVYLDLSFYMIIWGLITLVIGIILGNNEFQWFSTQFEKGLFIAGIIAHTYTFYLILSNFINTRTTF